jgi:outer membrane protein
MKRVSILIILWCFAFTGFSQELLKVMDAVQAALRNNYSIVMARNDAEVASNNNNIGTAGFLPVAGAAAGYQGNLTSSSLKYFDGRNIDATNKQSTSLTAAATVDWTLFNGMAMFTSKAQLAELEKMGDNDLRMMIENTVASVIMNYYALVQFKQMEAVLQQAIQLSLERKRLAEMKLRLGSGSELDLLQAIVDMHADSSTLILQQNQVRTVKVEINKLMVRDVETDFEVANEIPYSDTLKYHSIVQQTIAQSPQMMAARYNARLAMLDVRQARSVFYPVVGVFGGYSYTGSNSQAGLVSDNTSYGLNYGATVTLNLFNGLNNINNLKNAKLMSENADLTAKQTELNLRGDVAQLYDDYRTALMLVGFETDNVRIARENTAIAFEKYNLGAMTDIDLRTTQQKLLDAERRLLTAQYEAKNREIELRVISGSLMKNLGF